MNAIIYCRVSSKEQIDGTSLAVQSAACRQFAHTNNMTVVREFVEQGESAKFADRTQLIELLDYCRKHGGTIHSLLVWKVDRLARNVSDHFSIKATLLKHGVKVISVTEAIGANPEGQLMETILAGFAQFDNDVRAMRTTHGMRKRLQEGIQPWHAPLGYRSSQGKGERKNVPDMADQPTFDLLKIAWERFATGAYTKRDIRRLLCSLGVVSKRGQYLSDQSVDKIFVNPYYAGILKDPWSGDEIEGKHPPMVSREDFARVQMVIKRRNRSIAHHKLRAEFALRGLVRCPECQHRLTGSFTTGRSARYAYYHCKNKDCSRRTKSIPVALADTEFTERLKYIKVRPEFIKPLTDILLKHAKQQDETHGINKTHVAQRLEGIQKQLDELLALRARDIIDDTEFLAHRNRLKTEQYEMQSIVRNTSVSILDQLKEQLKAVMPILTSPANTWKKLRMSSRHRFYQILFPFGMCVGKSRTAELGLLFSIFLEKSGDTFTDVTLEPEKWNQICEEIQVLYEISKSLEEPESVEL